MTPFSTIQMCTTLRILGCYSWKQNHFQLVTSGETGSYPCLRCWWAGTWRRISCSPPWSSQGSCRKSNSLQTSSEPDPAPCFPQTHPGPVPSFQTLSSLGQDGYGHLVFPPHPRTPSFQTPLGRGQDAQGRPESRSHPQDSRPAEHRGEHGQVQWLWHCSAVQWREGWCKRVAVKTLTAPAVAWLWLWHEWTAPVCKLPLCVNCPYM